MHIFGVIYWTIAIALFGLIIAKWDDVGGKWTKIGFLVVAFCSILWPIGIPGAVYVSDHEDEIMDWVERHSRKGN